MNTRFYLLTFCRVCILTVLTTSLLACQLIDFKNSDVKDTNKTYQRNDSLGEYYLWIGQLNKYELQTEAKSLEANVQQMSTQGVAINSVINSAIDFKSDVTAYYRLLLLHSLINASLPNAALIKTQLTAEQKTQLSVNDLALVLMAQDKIQQRVLMRGKLLSTQKTNAKAKEQLKTQQAYINELELRSQKLQQQIIQLKAIERSIDDHGTPL